MQIFECIGILQINIKKLSAEVTRLASLQKDHLQEDNRRAARETQVEIDLQSTYACDGMKHGYLEIIKIILTVPEVLTKESDLVPLKNVCAAWDKERMFQLSAGLEAARKNEGELEDKLAQIAAERDVLKLRVETDAEMYLQIAIERDQAIATVADLQKANDDLRQANVDQTASIRCTQAELPQRDIIPSRVDRARQTPLSTGRLHTPSHRSDTPRSLNTPTQTPTNSAALFDMEEVFTPGYVNQLRLHRVIHNVRNSILDVRLIESENSADNQQSNGEEYPLLLSIVGFREALKHFKALKLNSTNQSALDTISGKVEAFLREQCEAVEKAETAEKAIKEKAKEEHAERERFEKAEREDAEKLKTRRTQIFVGMCMAWLFFCVVGIIDGVFPALRNPSDCRKFVIEQASWVIGTLVIERFLASEEFVGELKQRGLMPGWTL
jgi:hypothetical protein